MYRIVSNLTRLPPMAVDDGSRALIPYEDYSKVFDRCSVEHFDIYRRRFRTIHLSLLTLNHS